jgi:hypothetical protein
MVIRVANRPTTWKPITVLYKYKRWGLGADGFQYAQTLAAPLLCPTPETLAVRVVLAHQHSMFHPCMCGLRGGAIAVVAMLIGYATRGCCWDKDEEIGSWDEIDYFLYTDAQLCWIKSTLTHLPLLRV